MRHAVCCNNKAGYDAQSGGEGSTSPRAKPAADGIAYIIIKKRPGT